MKVKYFHDTDTALVEFSEREVTETKEINENIYIERTYAANRRRGILPRPEMRKS